MGNDKDRHSGYEEIFTLKQVIWWQEMLDDTAKREFTNTAWDGGNTTKENSTKSGKIGISVSAESLFIVIHMCTWVVLSHVGTRISHVRIKFAKFSTDSVTFRHSWSSLYKHNRQTVEMTHLDLSPRNARDVPVSWTELWWTCWNHRHSGEEETPSTGHWCHVAVWHWAGALSAATWCTQL